MNIYVNMPPNMSEKVGMDGKYVCMPRQKLIDGVKYRFYEKKENKYTKLNNYKNDKTDEVYRCVENTLPHNYFTNNGLSIKTGKIIDIVHKFYPQTPINTIKFINKSIINSKKIIQDPAGGAVGENIKTVEVGNASKVIYKQFIKTLHNIPSDLAKGESVFNTGEPRVMHTHAYNFEVENVYPKNIKDRMAVIWMLAESYYNALFLYHNNKRSDNLGFSLIPVSASIFVGNFKDPELDNHLHPSYTIVGLLLAFARLHNEGIILKHSDFDMYFFVKTVFDKAAEINNTIGKQKIKKHRGVVAKIPRVLPNMGGKCYSNSVIQMVLRMDDFVKNIIPCRKNDDIIDNFIEMLHMLYTTKNPYPNNNKLDKIANGHITNYITRYGICDNKFKDAADMYQKLIESLEGKEQNDRCKNMIDNLKITTSVTTSRSHKLEKDNIEYNYDGDIGLDNTEIKKINNLQDKNENFNINPYLYYGTDEKTIVFAIQYENLEHGDNDIKEYLFKIDINLDKIYGESAGKLVSEHTTLDFAITENFTNVIEKKDGQDYQEEYNKAYIIVSYGESTNTAKLMTETDFENKYKKIHVKSTIDERMLDYNTEKKTENKTNILFKLEDSYSEPQYTTYTLTNEHFVKKEYKYTCNGNYIVASNHHAKNMSELKKSIKLYKNKEYNIVAVLCRPFTSGNTEVNDFGFVNDMTDKHYVAFVKYGETWYLYDDDNPIQIQSPFASPEYFPDTLLYEHKGDLPNQDEQKGGTYRKYIKYKTKYLNLLEKKNYI